MMGLFLKFLGCMPSDRSSGICFHGDFKSSRADGEGEGTLKCVAWVGHPYSGRIISTSKNLLSVLFFHARLKFDIIKEAITFHN